MTLDSNHHDLAALLDWQRAMGVDAALADEATDWLTRGLEAPGAGFAMPRREPAALKDQSPHGPGTQPANRAPPSSPGTRPPPAVAPLRAPASPIVGKAAPRPAAPVTAADMAELEAKLRAFDGCGLKATATNLCFYRGAATARLMIIGEAPGREEDLEGRPFVGRAGQLLDKMLAAIGFAEDQVHITNIVYWRPPGERTPSPLEALACRPFLEAQASLARPDVVLLLGGSATKYILNTDEGIMKLRGKWSDISLGGRVVKAMATLHPDYMFRTPASKRQVWRDLLAVKEFLK